MNTKSRKKQRNTAITAQQVAIKLGVSQSTVSRAFTPTASIDPDTRARVMKAAKAAGYQPNIIARSLITRRTNMIAVVMANLTDPFYPLVLDCLTKRIQASGRQLLLFIIPSGDVDDVLPSLFQYKVDAVVITSATVSSRIAKACAARNLPVILFNRYVPGLKVAAVCCDNVAGGRAIAEFFVERGHKRPAFVSGKSDVTTNIDRHHGFKSRLQQLGVKLTAHENAGDYSYSAGFAAAQRLVRRRRPPDSIFFASDIMAIGGIDAIRDFGLRVPADISVIGFDDVPVAAWPSYQLTTIRQPITQMVDAAAETLGLDAEITKINSHKALFLRGNLIERKSVMDRN